MSAVQNCNYQRNKYAYPNFSVMDLDQLRTFARHEIDDISLSLLGYEVARRLFGKNYTNAIAHFAVNEEFISRDCFYSFSDICVYQNDERFIGKNTRFMPVVYCGYSSNRFSLSSNNRIFRINLNCFQEEHPIICFSITYQNYSDVVLEKGLLMYKEVEIDGIRWLLLQVDKKLTDDHTAIFTNIAEKDFGVVISHWIDENDNPNDMCSYVIYNLVLVNL